MEEGGWGLERRSDPIGGGGMGAQGRGTGWEGRGYCTAFVWVVKFLEGGFWDGGKREKGCGGSGRGLVEEGVGLYISDSIRSVCCNLLL